MTGTNYADIFYSKYGNEISVLENTVNDNPVSSLAQFLVLYHYKKNNNPEFETLAKQTALYFNNPAWLQFQLFQTDLEALQSDSISTDVNETGHFAVILPEENLKADEVNQEKIFYDSSETEIKTDEPEIENTFIENEEENLLNKENISDSNESYEPINNNVPEENVSFEEIEIAGINKPSKIEDQTPFDIQNSEPEKSEIGEKYSVIEKKEETIPAEFEEKIADVTHNDEENKDEKNQEEYIAFKPKEEILETDQIKNESPLEIGSEEPTAFEPANEIAEKISTESTTEPEILIEENENEVAFEPLHTVDYFASQGIKIREEMLTNDKLGKQMKSFTDWLKSMKKLHPGKLPEQNEVIEKIIQSSAEESNADAEVLTEAMAEVLIKQNKQEKAIEMYQKLSLMNPSKSAYFAAKIESIKTH